MTQQILNGFGSDGSRLWIPDNKHAAEAFYEDVYSGKAWERFVRDFGNTPENRQSIERVLDTLYPDDEVTVLRFEDAIRTGMDSGAIARRPVAPVVVPAKVPTDKNGKPLTAAQVKWGEFIHWSATASAGERKERARRDPAFAAFVQVQWQEEITQPVGDSVMDLNPHLQTQAPPTKSALNNAEIVAFAKRYRSMSADQVRSERSRAVNPLTTDKFIADMEKAIELHLI